MADFLNELQVGSTTFDLYDKRIEQVASTVASNSYVPTNSAVMTYVAAAIAAIDELDYIVCNPVATEIPKGAVYKDLKSEPPVTITGTMECSAENYHGIYLVRDDNIISGTTVNVSYNEYIGVRTGSGTYSYRWELIGSTSTDVTGMVKSVGIGNLYTGEPDSNGKVVIPVTVWGNLAWKDSASGTVEGQTPSTSYQPAGTLNVSLKQTSTAATLTKSDYTPAGDIVGTVVTDVTGNLTLKQAATWTAGSFSETETTAAVDVSSLNISGSVSTSVVTKATLAAATSADADAVEIVPAVTVTTAFVKDVTVTSSNSYYRITGLGSTPTSKATTVVTDVTKGTAAAVTGINTNDAVNATVSGHTLILGAASITLTTAAFVNSVTPTTATIYEIASLGSKPTGSTGKLVTDVTFTTATVEPVVTGGYYKVVNTSSKVGITASGTGSGSVAYQRVSGVSYKATEVSKLTIEPTKSASALSFSGTTAASILVTGVNYDKSTVSTATFTGTTATLQFTVASKNVTVS